VQDSLFFDRTSKTIANSVDVAEKVVLQAEENGSWACRLSGQVSILSCNDSRWNQTQESGRQQDSAGENPMKQAARIRFIP